MEKAGGKSKLDLGCGDGSLLACLIRLTDFEEYYGLDVAQDLLKEVDPRVKTAVYDLLSPGPLPATDVTIVAGVIQYVFDDEAVRRALSLIHSPLVLVRSTCTLLPEDERVVRDDYGSLYRTLQHTLALLSEDFVVAAVDRVYPDEIESKFGTKQFYFEARPRSSAELP